MRRRFINSHKTFDYSKYMTIEALEDGYEVSFTRDVEYNLNGHKWVSLKANLNSPTLKKGDLLSLRCSLMQGEVFGGFKGNGKAINLRGNILSLIFKDDINLDISGYNYVFEGIFAFNKGSNIISVEKNFLPAKKLGVSCYYSMFSSCKNLITAPELPATTLARGCYSNMFFNCTSLTTAPELPATTLADYCYYNMFQGCGKLNYIKMLATDISASKSLNNWVSGVASSGTFVKNPAMTSLPTGVSGIPSGWTVVNDGEESGGDSIFPMHLYLTKISDDKYLHEPSAESIALCDWLVDNLMFDGEGGYDTNIPNGSLFIDDVEVTNISFMDANGIPGIEQAYWYPSKDYGYMIFEIRVIALFDNGSYEKGTITIFDDN